MKSFKHPCSVRFSDNGRVMEIIHKSQRTVARILVHSTVESTFQACHNGDSLITPINAELFELSSLEQLSDNGEITDKKGESK